MLEDVGVSDEEGGVAHTSQVAGLRMDVADWKVWCLALALTSMVIALSFNAFFPTLTATLGYSRTVTLLLCAPPWGFATIVAFAVTRWVSRSSVELYVCVLTVCRHSDKTGERFWHIAIPLVFGIVGFVIAASTMHLAARYISL